MTQGLQLVVYLGLAAVAIRTWRRQGGPAAAWLAATFAVLGTVVLAATALPLHSDGALVTWAIKAVVAAFLLFPYFLYRFTAAFERPPPRWNRAAAALTAAVLTATFLVPHFPEDGDPRPGWWAFYVAAALVQWSVLSVTVAVRLWGAGRDQAALARRRMRLMALGSVVLDLALVLAASASADPHPAIVLATRLLGFLSVGLFFVGFSPPAALRIIWRHPDVRLLREAEEGLMAAVDTAEVSHILLPRVTGLFGGKGSALVGEDGTVTAAHGLSAEEAATIATATDRADVISAPMRKGRLVVQSSPYAPFFGREEDNLLRGLALFADLALARAGLFAQERESRRGAEMAKAELETFVYTVSHDLKSPLVSLSGYLDIVRAELGDSATGDVAFSLARMDASARYMHDLIRDLLELSRIGRVQTEAADVDLVRLVEDVADELSPCHPAARITADGLPTVHLNPLRARQLFTNLVGNALAHAGRPDVHVEVRAERRGDLLRIVVADNGRGIPALHRDRVFRVFEQGQGEGSEPAAGTGIGLAVCRKIVEQAGGTIEALDSGEGAAIEVRLPGSLVRRSRAPVAART